LKKNKSSRSIAEVIKQYYWLTKPGIIRGNLIALVAGFLLASRGVMIDWWLLVFVAISVSLVIGSACVLNNVLDRRIDAMMDRTKKRAIASGDISPRDATWCGMLLGVIGFAMLALVTNPVTVFLGVFGWFGYIVIYGYAKRRTHHSTLIGALFGAIPPIAGYTAVSGRIDTVGLLLFGLLVLWQMPHFYAIALYRQKDYTQAKLPLLPIVRSARRTVIEMIAYVMLLGVAVAVLGVVADVSKIILLVMISIVVLWLIQMITGYRRDIIVWARATFGGSLLVLLALMILLSLEGIFSDRMI
jgi:protoheme IX farnesyltransferase